MKLMGWAMAFLGLWIVLDSFIAANWVDIAAGAIIVVLSVIAALKK
ncbi:MAG: hypothetical protein Q8O43_11045 [Dehalococcoidia bacterium]|nr:hypothetical protein [Dehalococcoidia bacterium]